MPEEGRENKKLTLEERGTWVRGELNKMYRPWGNVAPLGQMFLQFMEVTVRIIALKGVVHIHGSALACLSLFGIRRDWGQGPRQDTSE
jgi:hypothetical protein